jgi:phosphatidylserine/phosphatidylglycerophosphate/cardiolipin synthase-like enzyme
VIGFGAPKRRFARLKQALFRGRRPGRLCFTIHNTVRLFKTGQEFFPALIERIDAAKLDERCPARRARAGDYGRYRHREASAIR